MKRRTFIKNSCIASAALSLGGAALANPTDNLTHETSKKILNAYYFRAHMYTMVPRQVREDLQWMADLGTDIVSVAILEQDLYAAVENVEIICSEAEKLGMQIHAVPSRWGGMFAGAPKVPSTFSVTHPNTWILEKNSQPLFSEISGVISSIHYPEVYEFFCTGLDKIFTLWNIQGIIWDEPKSFRIDYSPKATETLGIDAPLQAHVQAVVDFHGKLNQHIKEKYPDKTTSLFNVARASDMVVELSSQTKNLDYFGADGRPWRPADEGQQVQNAKTLLVNGERHLAAARAEKKKTLWLIENLSMRSHEISLMQKRMPEVLSKDIDQLIYYYFPRSLEDPEANMNTVARCISEFKK